MVCLADYLQVDQAGGCPAESNVGQQDLLNTLGQCSTRVVGLAGYLLFEQVRWVSQVQLQGMQTIAFVMVATGNYLDTGDKAALLTQLSIHLPSIGACCRLPRPDFPP